MLVKDKSAGFGLEGRLEHVDDIISTLALANCLQVEEIVDHYQ